MFFKFIPESIRNKDYAIIPTILPPIVLLFLLSLFIRIFFMIGSDSFKTDVDLFMWWAYNLSENGLDAFYYADFFKDYPPGYMYVLYVLGAIGGALKLEVYSEEYIYLIKMVPIIFDCLISCFIFFIANKKMNFTANKAMIIALFYALNPTVIHNSTIWGQVDAFYVLIMISSLYFLNKKDYTSSYMLYVFSVFTKPQALIIGPIYLYSVLEYLFTHKNLKENMKFLIKYFLISVVTALVICLPFIQGFDFSILIDNYMATLDSYPYATVNAYNFYAIFDGNYASIDTAFLFTTFKTFGFIMLIVITLYSLFFLYKTKEEGKYYFCAGMLFTFTYMFSIKMHERYLLPALACFLIYFIYSKNKNILAIFCAFSITLYINCVEVMKMSLYDNSLDIIKYSIAVIPYFNFVITVFLIYVSIIIIRQNKVYGTEEQKEVSINLNDFRMSMFHIKIKEFAENINFIKLEKIDYKIIIVITLFASILGLYNLGQNYNPQTSYVGEIGDEVTFNFDPDTQIEKMRVFLGSDNDKDIQFIINGEERTENLKSVFRWVDIDINENTDTIVLDILDENTRIMEMAFMDEDNMPISVAVTPNENNAKLIDEQELVPQGYDEVKTLYTGKEITAENNVNYKNSTYFDEVYHPRTAYEIVNNLQIYETTHPPLGKDLMALSVKIQGFTPFAYRLPGVIFGILMIPLLYLLALQIFKSRQWGLFAAILFLFDFMHFTQTRIGTIDTFVTLFILASYYFMYKYYQMNSNLCTLKESLKPLFWSGLFMGLGIATKWTGVYSAVGLAVIFFYTVITRYKEILYQASIGDDILIYKNKMISILKSCFIFFLFIPIIIYFLSYIPYLMTDDWNGISDIIANQFSMLDYHSNLHSTHTFGSAWWMWPLDIRPVYYYAKDYGDNIVAGISAFYNPAIVWMGIVAFLYCIYKAVTTKENRSILIFIIIGYLAQYLPWIFITRTTYMYHYFPSIPFVILMIVFMLKSLFNVIKNKYVIIYLAVVIILFVLFYPVISGIAVNKTYVDTVLQWFSTWVLTP